MSTLDEIKVCRAVEQGKEWLKKTRPVYIEFLLARGDFRRAKATNLEAKLLNKALRRNIRHTHKTFAAALESIMFYGLVPGYVPDLRSHKVNPDDLYITLTLDK